LNIPKGFDSLDSGLLGFKHRIIENYDISELETDRNEDNLIEKVEYVTYSEPNIIKSCTINSIWIEIRFNDDGIDENKYPELYQLFYYYNLTKSSKVSHVFFDILRFYNPSTLYDLKNLYRGIKMFANDKFDKINICAKLVIDQDYKNDVAMLWIKWLSLSPPTNIFGFEYPILNRRFRLIYGSDMDSDDDFSLIFNDIDIYYKYNLFEFEAYQFTKKMAEKYCHSNFYKSVEYYGQFIKLLYCDEILKMIDSGNHFGEPLIALKYSKNLTDAERKAIKILNIDNEEYKTPIDKTNEFSMLCFEKQKSMDKIDRKRMKKRRNAYKMNNKYQTHRRVQKQYSYHRSRR